MTTCPGTGTAGGRPGGAGAPHNASAHADSRAAVAATTTGSGCEGPPGNWVTTRCQNESTSVRCRSAHKGHGPRPAIRTGPTIPR
ncbi:hypothetical protein QP028_03830 [Corynebacterium suedekumii]|nr:hypothetical protein QP028_03830 [Corynebacterium suedekumii]